MHCSPALSPGGTNAGTCAPYRGAYPAVTSALHQRGAIVADEVAYSRQCTGRRLKCTLPSPYIMGNRMWSAEHSKSAYPNREDFMAACVPILREEIKLVQAAGADIIQLDEPWVRLGCHLLIVLPKTVLRRLLIFPRMSDGRWRCWSTRLRVQASQRRANSLGRSQATRMWPSSSTYALR